jgi:hypothetical protein
MACTTTEPQAAQYEIWLFCGKLRMPVQACGLFAEQLAAIQVGARLSHWLRRGEWNNCLTINGTDAEGDADELRDLPAFLRRQGCDPARALVTVQERALEADSAVTNARIAVCAA